MTVDDFGSDTRVESREASKVVKPDGAAADHQQTSHESRLTDGVRLLILAA